jgi:mRNA interferase RelE/StbE
MPFVIQWTAKAREDLRRIRVFERSGVIDAVDQYLQHEPRSVSKSRIKRLRGLASPQYRLRLGAIRVFYDVKGNDVYVLAVISKSESAAWLDDYGEPS